MITPNARSKTTIGTATATARVVVETPLLDFPALEAAEVLEDAAVEVPEVCSLFPALEAAELLGDAPVVLPVLPSSLPWPVDVPISNHCQNSHLRITQVRSKELTSLTRRPSSRFTLRTLRPSSQPAIIRTNDSEIIRVHHIRPGFQLDRVITPRERAVAVSEDERAVEFVAAPCVGAGVWCAR